MISNISFGQIKWAIIDADTKENIPFVNIWVENNNIGTISNEYGQFVLPKMDGTKVIVFSATGYNTKKIKFNLMKNPIELKPQIIELNEVVLTNLKKRKKEKYIDKLKTRQIRHYLPGFGKPWIFAKFFNYKKEYEETPFIKEISIAVETTREESKFLIHLLKINKEGKPQEYLNKKNLIVTAEKGKNIINKNISNLNIEVPENGLFVAVEWLLTKQNASVFDSFEPYIGFTHEESNENSWVYRFGAWKKVKSYNGEIYSTNTYKQLAAALKLSN